MIRKVLFTATTLMILSSGVAYARCPPGGAVPTPEAGATLGMLLAGGALMLARKRKMRAEA